MPQCFWLPSDSYFLVPHMFVVILTLHVYIYLLSNLSSISISVVTEEHAACIGTNLVLVQCILSLTNGCWSCRGMPGHGISGIGMPMVAANWALGVVSPLLGQALLVGIVLPTLGCQLLLSIVAAGITHRAVVVTGSWHCYCWHYFCWLFMAFLLLAFHCTIIILAAALGEWPLQHCPNLCLAPLYLMHAH